MIASLVKGMSIRATVRMTGVAKNTIQKLLLELGGACSSYQERVFVNLSCKWAQVDECWAFCYVKAKNVTEEIKAAVPCPGDVWTWAAIDADTKLIPSWIIGPRDATTARLFVNDLAGRLANRIQPTSDFQTDPLSTIRFWNATISSQRSTTPSTRLITSSYRPAIAARRRSRHYGRRIVED